MTTLIPMSQAAYLAFVEDSVPAYAADNVASGQWPQAHAVERSRKELDSLLPQGRATPDHHLFSIADDTHAVVGMLWFAAMDRAGRRIAYVYNVSIDAGHRRQGHATRAFEALEHEVRRLGLSGIALHVFGHNLCAQALYAKLGYQPTNINLFKPVPALL